MTLEQILLSLHFDEQITIRTSANCIIICVKNEVNKLDRNISIIQLRTVSWRLTETIIEEMLSELRLYGKLIPKEI